jgi:hypothetical protein
MAESQFCEVIERSLGRRVRAFISGMDTRKDVAAEIFYLESEEESEEGQASSAAIAASRSP